MRQGALVTNAYRIVRLNIFILNHNVKDCRIAEKNINLLHIILHHNIQDQLPNMDRESSKTAQTAECRRDPNAASDVATTINTIIIIILKLIIISII